MRRIELAWGKIKIGKDGAVEWIDAGGSKSALDESCRHETVNLAVLMNNVVVINGHAFDHLLCAVLCPALSNLGINNDIEGLQPVGALRRKGNENDPVLESKSPDNVQFVRLMSINKQDKGIISLPPSNRVWRGYG